MSVKKTISMLVLVGASAAVWAPQLLESKASTVDQSAPVDLDLGDSDVFALDDSVEQSIDPSVAGSVAEQVSGEHGTSHSSAIKALVAESGDTAKVDQDLSSLLGSMRSFRPEGPAIQEDLPKDQGPANEASLGLFEAKLVIDENPLTAILVHPSESRAIMGSRVLREGDMISPGLAVERIEAGRVWVRSDAGLMEVSLPAVRARALPVEDVNGEIESDPASAGAPEGEAGISSEGSNGASSINSPQGSGI